jgi:hypothetical protein
MVLSKQALATVLAGGLMAVVGPGSAASFADDGQPVDRDDDVSQDDPSQDDPSQDDEPTQDEEAPEGVSVRQFSYAGTGCPAGTIRGDLPVDGRTFLIFWDAFAAEAGPGIPLPESRKNCQILLDLDYPAGWQYTLGSIDYSGHLVLEDGVEATAASAFYFQGSGDTARADKTFVGPLDADYHEVVDFAAETEGQVIWSPCEATRAINVNVQVRVNSLTARDRNGLITFATDPETQGSLLALKWRRCD